MEDYLHLKVPASTANLGVGFDSIGMAIDKYLHLYVYKIAGENWQFHYLNKELDSLPKIKIIIFIKLRKRSQNVIRLSCRH